METQICSIGDQQARQMAQKLIQQKEVVAVPTDTVYGICCRFDCEEALARLYKIKGRPPEKAIPVLLGEDSQLARLTQLPLSPIAERLIAQFWPGPLTLVLAAQPGLPAILTAGQPTIGVRLPNHMGLRTLLRQSGPLATTSANLSGGAETTSARAVYAQLAGRLPLILADEHEAALWADEDRRTKPLVGVSPPVAVRQASTVVDLTEIATSGPRILREGSLGRTIAELFAAGGPYLC